MTTFDKAHFPHLHGPSSQEKGDAVVSLPRLRSGSGSLQHITTIPDLRFEQSYLKSIAPYVQTRRISGAGDDSNSVEVIGVEWRNVMWITVRDQLISPLLQGAIWGVATIFIRPVFSRIGSFFGFSRYTPQPSKLPEPKGEGELTRRLREWSKSLTSNGL